MHYAGSALLIRQAHVVNPGDDILQGQPLIVVDRAVGIVLALIGAPGGGSGGSQGEVCDGTGRQVPEPQALGRTRVGSYRE
jgi:hypothetical protein